MALKAQLVPFAQSEPYDLVKQPFDEVVKLFKDNGVNLFSNPSDLVTLVEKKNLNLVKLLIDNGIDVNAKCNGRNALSFAVKAGHQGIVKLLLDSGANVNVKDNVGETALMDAVEYGNKEIVELLLQNDADVNLRDKYSRTALIRAVVNGRKDIVELLLQNGANVCAKTLGKTTLMVALEYKEDEIADVLIEYGARFNVRSK